jgi:hypothetical protein
MPSGIDNARTQVEALRRALLSPSPEEIERCLPALEEVMRSLSFVEKELPDDACGQLEMLSKELRIVNRLIERGAAFYRGWAEMLGAAAAGYMPTGEAAPIARLFDGTTCISIRG